MNAQTDIRDFIPGLHGQGKHKYCVCPFCGKEGKGKGLVTYTPKGGNTESAAYCHACEKGFNNAVSAVMHYENLKYPEAIRYVAEKSNFLIEEALENKFTFIYDIQLSLYGFLFFSKVFKC